ncbi:MAG: NAD(P)/FAD-dependent oxidoreductase, partial [Thermoproteota archaeon]
YEERNIDIHTDCKAVCIRPAKRKLVLEEGSEVDYDRLLLANGAHPFVPPIEGKKKEGIFTLRSIRDALAIKKYAEKTDKAVIMGGGLLGLEFAASLKRLGQKVLVVELFSRLLPKQLDEDGADVLRDQIEKMDIKVKLGAKTEKILGGTNFSGLKINDGREFSGDLLLISAGMRSNVALAKEAGIEVNRGVVVNEYLETSVNDIFAAGDVAEFEGENYGNIPAAVEQAGAAAKNILEEGAQTYEGTIPSTTLKIVGIDLTSIGVVNPEGAQYEEKKKTNQERGIYKKIVLEDGEIVGAILLGDQKGVTSIKKLMERKTDITKYKDSLLMDEFNFKKLL